MNFLLLLEPNSIDTESSLLEQKRKLITFVSETRSVLASSYLTFDRIFYVFRCTAILF